MLAVACNQELIEPEVSPDDNKAVLDFSVQLPDMTPATKAMADKPAGQLKSLHLAVFDEAGYLAEYVLATPIELAQDNGTRYSYTAKLSLSANPRIIHFIGNGPSSVRFGNEETVMAAIKSTGNEDLYWFRKMVPYIGGVQQGIDNAMQIDEQTRVYLSNIPLIRNFVKVVLVDETDQFTLKSYAVVNSLNDGMLAAYDTNNGNFVEYFNAEVSTTTDADGNVSQAFEYEPKSFDVLRGVGYDANIPSVTSYVSMDAAWTKAVGSGEPYFVYERETPADNPTYIIAYGTYQGKDYYYKIDLRDNNGAYFPLLRNFEYTIRLKTVSRIGYETMAEAAKSAGSGDISTALETISLVYISDGVASLEVGYTEKVVMSTDPITLDYTFLTDVTNDESYGPATSMRVVVNDDAGLSGPSIASVNGNSTFVPGVTEIAVTGNPGALTIVPTEPTAVPKTQSLTIFADYTNNVNNQTITKTLQRTVRIVSMTKRTMTAVCIPNEVPKSRGSEFALQITIPGGLSRGMFPLEFEIEAKNLTITPDTDLDNMPVESGISHYGKGSAFYFIKTLEWDEYDPLAPETSFLCYFETNTDVSASQIRVANPYFDYADTELRNYDPKYFQNLAFSDEDILIGEGVPFEFTFDITEVPSQGNVTVTLEGAEPDPEHEGQLTFIGLKDGKAQYAYAIPSGAELDDHKLYLVTSTISDDVVVTLDAYQFIQNSATAGRRDVVFTEVSLDNARVGIGQTTTFKFTYDSAADGVPVTLTLNGLKPQTGDGRFTDGGDNNGNTWTFTPNTTGLTQTITLETTTFGTGIGVTISADAYGYKTPVPVTAVRRLVIPSGKFTNVIDSDSNIRLYSSKPTNTWSGHILEMRWNSNGPTQNYELTGEFSETQTYWLRYYDNYGFLNAQRHYYISQEISIQELLSGCEINWTNDYDGSALDDL